MYQSMYASTLAGSNRQGSKTIDEHDASYYTSLPAVSTVLKKRNVGQRSVESQ